MILTGKEDLRVVKTIEAIKGTFEELIVEKDYEKITVKELCDRARINKKTFYHYYPALDDLLAELQFEISSAYIERIKNYKLPDDIQNVNRAFFEFSCAQGKVFEKITCSTGSYSYIRQKMINRVTSETWETSASFRKLDPFTQSVVLEQVNFINVNIYCKWIVPVGSVLTMVGTGSEMNGGSVITNHEQKRKIGHVFGDNVMPKFSILNPKYTFTVPKNQMVAGIYDIFNHICEQYFSGEDDNTSDHLAEALMKSVIHASRIAVKDPEDYEARSNLMWCATWALNTLIAKGKTTDWEVHMIGQAIGAYTDATHGMTLSAVSLPYYRHIMPYGLKKFVRFAKEVWDISTETMSEQEAAEAGLAAMESWMKEIGVVLHAKELGVTEEMIDGIADATFLFDGGYKALTREEVIEIVKESL